MPVKKGEEAFDEYFSTVYQERWEKIKKSLLLDDLKVARKNLFYPQDSQYEPLPGVGGAHEFLENCYAVEEGFDLSLVESPLLPYYKMDPASVIAARALQVQPGDLVLDMCAAPGGKSLVLMEDLVGTGDWDTTGRLVANEMSAKRKFRMMSVFKRYLPKEIRSMVTIKGMDGSKIGLNKKNHFDRILLDAPCSGERGVIQKKSDLDLWKEKRSKSFGIRQYSLLSSAFTALKEGGRIVYSTCSISPHENDAVIAKLEKRKSGEFKVIQADPVGPSEETQYGFQFLPDRDGWGPIYYAIIEKTKN